MSESSGGSGGNGCGCTTLIVLILVFVVWSMSDTAENDRVETQQLRERVQQLEHRPAVPR
jgi:hypothetical protein